MTSRITARALSYYVFFIFALIWGINYQYPRMLMSILALMILVHVARDLAIYPKNEVLLLELGAVIVGIILGKYGYVRDDPLLLFMSTVMIVNHGSRFILNPDELPLY